jgi:Flp pilus assembly protein TadG
MKKIMNGHQSIKDSPAGEKGQSLVEFAVTAIILLLLLTAIVDFGRALFTYVALRDAAQEGAVYGSICPLDASVIAFRARSASSTPVNLNDANIIVTCTYLGDDENSSGDDRPCGSAPYPKPGTAIQVTVQYPNFPLAMPFLGGFLGTQTFNLRATVKDTILRNYICN